MGLKTRLLTSCTKRCANPTDRNVTQNKHDTFAPYRILRCELLLSEAYFEYDRLINLLECFFGSKSHASLDRNHGPGYPTLLIDQYCMYP